MTPAKWIGLGALWLALAAIHGCGSGGGDGDSACVNPPGDCPPPLGAKGVFTGYYGLLDWDAFDTSGGGDGGDGGGDGDGGAGAGGGFGQFRNVDIVARFPDGAELGRAPVHPVTGLVTIRPGRGYTGPLLVELHGREGGEYFDEGKNTYVPFGPGNVVRALVPSVTKNIGLTPFSDAAWRLAEECRQGIGPNHICGNALGQANGTLPSTPLIVAANEYVTKLLNAQAPAAFHIDDVTRLPVVVNNGTGPETIAISGVASTHPQSAAQRGRYALLNAAFSKQAAMYNAAAASPTLAAGKQLSDDLLDGRLDGMTGNRPVATAAERSYDPATMTSELSSALAQQTTKLGNEGARAAMPAVVAFGNTRYDSYYFDARISPNGSASTIAVATESTPTRVPGETTSYVTGTSDLRGFMVYGNIGSGALFFKTDTPDSTSQLLAIGDNTDGELGVGHRNPVRGPTDVSLPGVVTHIAGGFGHTVARLADGRVFAWGSNAYAQLGQGMDASALERSSTPIEVALPAGALAVSASNVASFALLEDSSVYSWGSAWDFGTLGDGSTGGQRVSPAPVMTAAGPLVGVVQIAARDNDAIALTRDGAVWTWGSFRSRPELPEAGVLPGYTIATPVAGLPRTSGGIRKVMTEQGLFVALMSGTGEDGEDLDGAVYSWGVHFDITAGGVLNDAAPVRVLNLPPVRDIMPGGFQGYGQRPFDRMTGMAIDYDGGMWKLRGRVAERYDPANPTAQRRPQGQAPRPDCGSCHVVLPRTTPPIPTTGPACSVPPGILALLTSASRCETCHNSAPLSDGRVLGALNCVPPTNLPAPPTPTEATPLTGPCALPSNHVPTPPGTFCASCHNGIVMPPLGCLSTPVTTAPPLSTTATIAGVTDDVQPGVGAIASGGATNDPSPLLAGVVSATLAAGETVQIRRNSVLIGNAVTSGTSWTFQESGLGNGTYRYTARVGSTTALGPATAEYVIVVDVTPVAPAIDEIRIFDNYGSATGEVALSPMFGFTDDNSPIINVLPSFPLTSGQRIRVTRNGSTTAELSPGVNSFRDSNLASAAQPSGATTYNYSAQVVDTQGGPSGQAASISINLLPMCTFAAANTRLPGHLLFDHTVNATLVPAQTTNGTLCASCHQGDLLGYGYTCRYPANPPAD